MTPLEFRSRLKSFRRLGKEIIENKRGAGARLTEDHCITADGSGNLAQRIARNLEVNALQDELKDAVIPFWSYIYVPVDRNLLFLRQDKWKYTDSQLLRAECLSPPLAPFWTSPAVVTSRKRDLAG